MAKKTIQPPRKKNSGLIKLGIIAGAVIILFAAIIFLTNKLNSDKLKDNPYGTNDLNQATIDQLTDKNYQNIILPDALKEKIADGEPTFAYLFSPTCVHCQNFTPVLMPIAEDYGVHIDQLNVLEFDEAWQDYGINATPTLIFFEDGKEVNRLIGDAPEESVNKFFDTYAK